MFKKCSPTRAKFQLCLRTQILKKSKFQQWIQICPFKNRYQTNHQKIKSHIFNFFFSFFFLLKRMSCFCNLRQNRQVAFGNPSHGNFHRFGNFTAKIELPTPSVPYNTFGDSSPSFGSLKSSRTAYDLIPEFGLHLQNIAPKLPFSNALTKIVINHIFCFCFVFCFPFTFN